MSDIHSPINRIHYNPNAKIKPKLTRQEYMERNLRLQYVKIGLAIIILAITVWRWR